MRHAFLLCALAIVPAAVVAQSDDEAGVRRALTYYIRGHATGIADTMAKAFHPDAELKFVRNGQYTRRPLAEYLAGFSGRPAADEARRARRIVAMDITGTSAVAKLELDHGAVLLTDYMHLLKIDVSRRAVPSVGRGRVRRRCPGSGKAPREATR